MAAPDLSESRRWFVLLGCVLCSLVSCRESAADEAAAGAFRGQKRADAVDIVGRALFCFNDRYIYSGCQDSLRLGPGGALSVPPASVDAFCAGPCRAETELVLRCVDDVLRGSQLFRFYNGASVGDVRLALARGCGRTGLRGDFDVLQRIGADDGYFYGGAGSSNRRPGLILEYPLLLSAAAAILL